MKNATLSQIDLHFHAGLERQPGCTLKDYLQHAYASGRRWQGVTDHTEFYIDPNTELYPGDRSQGAYPTGQAGMEALAAELAGLRAHFPEMHLFFAPEYFTIYAPHGPHLFPLEDTPSWLFELADYVLFDSGLTDLEGPRARTKMLVQAIASVSDLRERYGKPVYMAHPLRCLASSANSWRHPSPAVPVLAEQAAHLADIGLLNQLFETDLLALAHASAAHGVPLEINGMSQYQIRRAGPAVYQAYVAAYRLMAAEGARFVIGSDQHKLSEDVQVSGWWQPVAAIGEECLDQVFFEQLKISF